MKIKFDNKFYNNFRSHYFYRLFDNFVKYNINKEVFHSVGQIIENNMFRFNMEIWATIVSNSVGDNCYMDHMMELQAAHEAEAMSRYYTEEMAKYHEDYYEDEEEYY